MCACVTARAAFAHHEQVWESVYLSVFVRLKKERVQFLDEAQAKRLVPWPRDTPRKAQCGGLGTDLPRLVLLSTLAARCPPWRWVWMSLLVQHETSLVAADVLT